MNWKCIVDSDCVQCSSDDTNEFTIILLLHAVTGSMVFCTTEGANVLLYLGNIIIPILKVLLSSSNIITMEYAVV